MSDESATLFSYRYHYLSGAVWEPMLIGDSPTTLTLPDGSRLLFASSKPSNISDSDKTELVRQTQALFSVLSELTGEKSAHGQCVLYLRALQSATDSLFPQWKAIAHSCSFQAPIHKILLSGTTISEANQTTPQAQPSELFNFVPPSLISPDEEEM